MAINQHIVVKLLFKILILPFSCLNCMVHYIESSVIVNHSDIQHASKKKTKKTKTTTIGKLLYINSLLYFFHLVNI